MSLWESGVESRHAANIGRQGETPDANIRGQTGNSVASALLPLPGQPEGRSQKGEAYVGRKPMLSDSRGSVRPLPPTTKPAPELTETGAGFSKTIS